MNEDYKTPYKKGKKNYVATLRLSDEDYDKYCIIADLEYRNNTNLLYYIVTQYLDNYCVNE